MKKIILVLAAMLAAGFVFAENYTVKSVTGRATLQTGTDRWAELSAGKELTSTNVINTSLNTILVLVDEAGKEIKIKANQKGTVDLLVKSATTPVAGIKKSTINTNSIAAATTETTKGTATASSRASEAKEDLDWDE